MSILTGGKIRFTAKGAILKMKKSAKNFFKDKQTAAVRHKQTIICRFYLCFGKRLSKVVCECN